MKTLVKILLILASTFYGCQQLTEPPKKNADNSVNYTIRNLLTSKDGRWMTVKQQHPKNTDTLLVFDANKPEIPIAKFAKMTDRQLFIKNNKLLVSGNGKAILIDLLNLKQIDYQKIKTIDYLPILDRYLILDQENTLTVYNSIGKILAKIKNVKGNILTDSAKTMLFVTSKNDKNEVLDLSTEFPKIVYSSAKEITRIDLSKSAKMLMITERDNDLLKPIFINTRSGDIQPLKNIEFQDSESIEFTEVKNEKAYLIQFKTKVPMRKMPQIWYGNDGNLQQMEDGFSTKFKFIYWRPTDGSVTELPSKNANRIYTSFNNERYLLAFDPISCHNYETEQRLIDVYLYDLQENKYRQIFSKVSRIIYSPDGHYLLALSEKDKTEKQWALVDINMNTHHNIISRALLQNPVFSADNMYIFFEGNAEVWRYSIKNSLLKQFKLPVDNPSFEKTSKFSNRGAYTFFNIPIESNFIDDAQSLIIRTKDKDNKTTFFALQKNSLRKILSTNPDRIKEILIDTQLKNAFSIEENYNTPPKIIATKLSNGSGRIIFTSNKDDKITKNLRQEIISFTDPFGNKLKGTLFYPMDFDETKTYPMIVRIYQMQYMQANEYLVSGMSSPIYDKKALIEKGYFVYEPDISPTPIGSGEVALNCVNLALDAIKEKKYIDKYNIGLTGHSFGGYETNYIATQSKRFATYISSAGISDLIESYFSYNYNFHFPDYARKENNQHNFPAFSENKEVYLANTPVLFAEQVSAPILLWSGLEDQNIPPKQIQEFYIALKRNKKDVIALFYPNVGHVMFNGTPEAEDLKIRIQEWWDYFLKGKTNVEWINKQIKPICKNESFVN
ncbi:hypothetical protein DRF65_11385 [Chryseobacterium pennae]|uniref:Peptidase S9 prolyl oligopeptidase catalytic domain-containing protein n=1 Tax=Chryseobacterium pennae TaxID=2258962 RepID=A0A3D9C9C9_9FLAO|nr:prolyl oligopeptidase family serine peptidase [Chryseobacterium pennae]REC62308.1 hypothetical protein DRF65_11385 [Chryseobacterium pennae]